MRKFQALVNQSRSTNPDCGWHYSHRVLGSKLDKPRPHFSPSAFTDYRCNVTNHLILLPPRRSNPDELCHKTVSKRKYFLLNVAVVKHCIAAETKRPRQLLQSLAPAWLVFLLVQERNVYLPRNVLLCLFIATMTSLSCTDLELFPFL